MCGIVAVWCREGVFSIEHFDKLFLEAEKRGQNGFGIVIHTKGSSWFIHELESYSNKRDEVLKKFQYYIDEGLLKTGSLILANFRAQPETEVPTSYKNLQPIIRDNCILVHNGVVANFIKDELAVAEEPYYTDIDSEAILTGYQKFNKNLKEMMEYMVGGFAFLLYDMKQNRLHCVSDFKPLSIGYVKGYGLILHSSEEAIASVVNKITDCNRCGLNVWEDFYYHPQEGYQIRSIDLDSGIERLNSYQPRIYHPHYNKIPKNKEPRKLALISASGGIDSGLTAQVLTHCGYDVELIHFSYGQKSEDAERECVQQLTRHFDCWEKIIDVRAIFGEDPSQLIDEDEEITTGSSKDIKTVSAWVANRNGVFLSILTSLAEQRILSRVYDEVYIASGMSNLSESGFYPDNSERFIGAFSEMIKYSTITWPKIKYISVFQDIMKYEEWILGNDLAFPFEKTCSCDDAKMEPRTAFEKAVGSEANIELCNQCGSTLLSKWAAQMAGVTDPRKFYDKEVNIEIMAPKVRLIENKPTSLNIISRLRLPAKEDYMKLFKIVKNSS